MGAICGCVYIDGKEVKLSIGNKMIKHFNNYKLDSVNTIYHENIFMGCGIQYVTPESLIEVLPLKDDNRELIITADAIIDNREELFKPFNIDKQHWDKITDSELILLAYEKWKEECPKFLVGDFAFAIYDKKKKRLFCARDHVGKRTLYYSYKEDVFGFSTLMRPLFDIFDKKVQLNEKWITDFLAIDGVLQESQREETVYENIYQVPAGNSITIDSNGLKKVRYWNPLKTVKRLKLKSDKEYKEKFLEVFSESVRCRLRCNGDIGVMMSGGLDSTSVACIAANQLKEENKKLKAYASVPMKGYINKEKSYYIPDETEYIEAIKNHVKNIDINYCRSEGKNSLTNIDYFIETLEQPYKVVENLYWIDEITKTAAQNNCKILLDGQYGNFTISYGDILTHLLTLYKSGNISQIIKEVNSFSRVKNVPRKIVYKRFAKMIVPYTLRKSMFMMRNKNSDRFSLTPVNPDLLKKWEVEKRFDKEEINILINKHYDKYESDKFIVDSLALYQAGAIETKTSLKYGLVRRDPTRDKRIIELCISLPSDQFVKTGVERYLVREYMKDILPDKVRLNTSKKGIQGADRVQRLGLSWKEINKELYTCLEDEAIKKYIDIDKVKESLDSIGTDIDETKWFEIRMCIIVYIFNNFIKNFEENSFVLE